MALNWHSARHAALWSWHQLLTLALAVLVLVAILVGVGRQFAPAVSDYRVEIEARLTRAVGLPVRIERISGSLQGMTPFFLIEGLRLQDPAAPAVTLLRIPRLELRPSLLQSLRALEPRVDLRVRGLDIHLDQLPDGQLRLRELASVSRSDPEAARRAVRAALRQPLLAIEDGRVQLALHGYPVLRLTNINLTNLNVAQEHRLAGEVHLEGVPQSASVNLSLQGDPVQWQKGQLVAWLGLPALQLDAWLPKADVAGISLQQVTGGGEFWLHFSRGHLMALQARPRLREAIFSSPYGHHVLHTVGGELAWARIGKGWTFSARYLTARLDNAAWPVPALAITSHPGQLAVAVAGMDVATAALLVNRLPLPEKLAEWLREATPEGRVTALRADLAADTAGQWEPRQIDARVERMGAHATDTLPGGRNLAGWVHWTPEQTLLALDARSSSLDLRQVFREPVAVDQLQGIVRIQAGPDLWRVESNKLKVRNADATGQALLRLDIPKADPHAAELSLLARLHDARVASTWRYVPWPSAGDKALDWLRRALIAGTVTQGDFLFAGPLVHKEGEMPMRHLMRFDVAGASLDYSPGWPALHGLDGVVTIDGAHLSVEARQARLLDGTVARQLRADIPDLREARLAVSGAVQSTGPDLIRLFRESPLRTHTAALADILQIKGGLQGQLALDIPLSPALPPGASVVVGASLNGNQLELPRQQLVVDSLKGNIRYTTRRGLEADDIQGRLLGAPVSARISSTVRGDLLDLVQVDLDGQVGIPALQRWLGGPLWGALSGDAPYQARIRIPSGQQSAQLQINSSLAGLRILLPAPLGKGDAPLPFQYQSSLGGEEQLARLKLGKQLSAGLVWRDGTLYSGVLKLGGGDPGWPSAPGIEIDGRVPRLVVADWQPWVERFRQAPVTGGRRSSIPGLTRLVLDARELDANGWRLGNVRLDVGRETAGWRIGLVGDDLDGSLQLPDAEGSALKVDIARLHWPLPGVPDVLASGSNAAVLSSRPVSVSAEGIRLRQYPGFGLVSGQVRLSPSPYGVRMDDLKVTTDVAGFEGRLDWQWRGGDSTRLRGVATSGDVAGLLKALRFAPSLHSPQARAEVDLTWPSTPQAVALKGLEGSLALRVENGRLLNVNTATSASRVFGLVDLENIRRRLKGDFSDVLRTGLSFDAVTLNGNVQSGQMPRAVFDLSGPSLTAHGEGRLDLVHQQIDQAFTVNVPVTSAVPLAAAVVAGPLVGGAVAAAELAFKKQINKVTVMHYHISGDWNDPQVERLNQRSGSGSSSGVRP